VETTNSQFGQDLWIKKLANKTNGFFVELGARDGKLTSNTYLLEKELNWTGILVECSPQNYKRLQQLRPNCILDNRAISNKSGEYINFYPGLSSGVGSIYKDPKFTQYRAVKVKTITLSDLLKEHNAPHEIDYISLDVEGAEELALEGFNWDYKVNYWTIESENWMDRYEDKDRRNKIKKIMLDQGYKIFEGKHQIVEDWFYL
jgi:FkbM family methyltransferase